MGGGECGNLGSGVEAPGKIFKIIPPYGLLRPVDVAPSGVAVCPMRNTWCWEHLCTTGGGIKIRTPTPPRPNRGKERGGHLIPIQVDHLGCEAPIH